MQTRMNVRTYKIEMSDETDSPEGIWNYLGQNEQGKPSVCNPRWIIYDESQQEPSKNSLR